MTDKITTEEKTTTLITTSVDVLKKVENERKRLRPILSKSQFFEKSAVFFIENLNKSK